ncbi:hypothetical protein JW962_00465 [Candidatus Dojkabacteria bacterium]|nr:hypothetical protein [Candidatus Dojkabacteria bacterium]
MSPDKTPTKFSRDVFHDQYDIRDRYVGTDFLLDLVTDEQVCQALGIDSVTVSDSAGNSINVKALYLGVLRSGIADCKKLLTAGGVIDSVGRVIAEYEDVEEIPKDKLAELDRRRDKVPTSGQDYKERLKAFEFYRGTAQGLFRNGIKLKTGLDYERLPTVKKICIIKPGLDSLIALGDSGLLYILGRQLDFKYIREIPKNREVSVSEILCNLIVKRLELDLIEVLNDSGIVVGRNGARRLPLNVGGLVYQLFLDVLLNPTPAEP